MSIRCMLVDDEPPAIDLLKKHISTLSNMEVVASCHSAIEASEILKEESIDLLFLDIQMPVLTGLDFLKTTNHLPKIILTTAHREYALEGYDLDVIDYLLKPISFQRFFKAVQKYHQQIEPKGVDRDAEKEVIPVDHIYVNINKKHYKVLFDSILYIESLKDYVRIHTTDQPLIVKGNIGSILERLPNKQFLRIHRSYIIAINKITAYTHLDIEIDGIEIPIGPTYKETLKVILS